MNFKKEGLEVNRGDVMKHKLDDEWNESGLSR